MNASPAVVFDLGKVLLDFDYQVAVKRLAAAGTADAPAVQRLLLESSLLADFESGRLDSRGFFGQLQNTLDLNLDYPTFRAGFAEIFTPITDMIDLHRGLRDRGVPTFILSNTNEIAVSHIRQSYPFFHEFDGYVLSHEVGSLKPDALIYHALESCAARSGSRLFYLDDRSENVQAALTRGWRAVIHTSPKTSRLALREAGFPV